ncbi:hypothetical protein SAMN05216483_6452 [Streptomyces sp. 2131.1]|nr:helicase [Streptomyces sp. 2131.1]SEE50948.1 hypothetical protein SAMN05216483_6452 [Streptomyces sp. 2131.1]
MSVRLGVFLSSHMSGRDRRIEGRLAALADLGLEWAA